MKPGSIVRPILIPGLNRNGVIYLTPLDVNSDWPEWHPNEVGVIISFESESETVKVIIPNGIGFCLCDEVKEIT